METHDERIPEETFAEFLSRLPQVSVELFLETERGVLLVRRTNEPAKGEWFWPGTRLYKGERFPNAVRRLAKEELGLDVDVGEHLGTYEHFWDTGAFDSVDNTHGERGVQGRTGRTDAGTRTGCTARWNEVRNRTPRTVPRVRQRVSSRR